MRIGIFFGYGPGIKLGAEGLGRYIGNLTKGFVNVGHKISIACPKWMIQDLLDLFDDFEIPEESIKFITSQKMPALWVLYNYLDERRRTRKRHSRRLLLLGCATFLEWAAGVLIRITSMLILGIVFLTGLLVGILSLPILLVAFILYTIYRIVYAVTQKSKFTIQGFAGRLRRALESLSSTGLSIEFYLLRRMTENVIEELIRKINRSNENVWYIPGIFWPQVQNIKKITVINTPDLVTSEFPHGFADDHYMAVQTQECASTIEAGKYFITYCEYLRQELVIKQFGKMPEQVIAIPHANNSMKEYLAFDADRALPVIYTRDNEYAFARELLCGIGKYAPADMQPYLNRFDFKHIQYIFYASQLRPSKNIFNLIKAYEYLLRRKNVTIKLFLTCNLNVIPEVKNYVYTKRLQNDILTFHGVPAQMLAALYKCASLVVNPTMYEGGFLFTFGEGMSVGTPSIMSRIPQVTYVTDRYDVDDILFDPYDYKAIADKIEYGLAHREELYKKEKPMYDQECESRTNRIVADEYAKAFQYFIDLSREEEIFEKT